MELLFNEKIADLIGGNVSPLDFKQYCKDEFGIELYDWQLKSLSRQEGRTTAKILQILGTILDFNERRNNEPIKVMVTVPTTRFGEEILRQTVDLARSHVDTYSKHEIIFTNGSTLTFKSIYDGKFDYIFMTDEF